MQKISYDFSKFNKDSLTKPRDLCWDRWGKFEKVGDKVQGFIRDVFYRPADGKFQEQRGITLEEQDGKLINVGIKRLPFILNKTDDLRLGDPLTIELSELKKSDTKGFSATKIFSFYGTNLTENKENKTVSELDKEDKEKGGTTPPEQEPTDKGFEAKSEDIPFN